MIERGFAYETNELKAIVDKIYNDRNHPIEPRDRFHNFFFYEVCPALKIVETEFGPESSLLFHEHSWPFDVSVWPDQDQPEIKMEMTAAIDGANEALRMELMCRRGHAPAIGKIDAQGTKQNREFGRNEPPASLAKQNDRENMILVAEAIQRKVEKSNKNESYRGAWLGVTLDDWLCVLQGSIHNRFDVMVTEFLQHTPIHYPNFARVYLVGVSRQNIKQLPQENP